MASGNLGTFPIDISASKTKNMFVSERQWWIIVSYYKPF